MLRHPPCWLLRCFSVFYVLVHPSLFALRVVGCFLTFSFFLGHFGLDTLSRCYARGLFRVMVIRYGGSKIGSQVVQWHVSSCPITWHVPTIVVTSAWFQESKSGLKPRIWRRCQGDRSTLVVSAQLFGGSCAREALQHFRWYPTQPQRPGRFVVAKTPHVFALKCWQITAQLPFLLGFWASQTWTWSTIIGAAWCMAHIHDTGTALQRRQDKHVPQTVVTSDRGQFHDTGQVWAMNCPWELLLCPSLMVMKWWASSLVVSSQAVAT